VKRRKICVVTTSRADFGLLSGLIKAIQADNGLRLQVIVSGMHLSPLFGRTWRDVEAQGIKIDRKIRLQLSGRSNLENLNSIGLGMKGFGKALSELRPDIVVLLGDRFELIAPAVSALLLGIPIAHIHGGELTEGAIDDSVRHAITKMASLHFAATEVYRKRIIQMGEVPERVFNFGAPGLDQIHAAPLMTRRQVELELGISLQKPVALVTYHPVTRDRDSVEDQLRSLIGAIEASGLHAVFTMANADAQGNIINRRLEATCAENPDRFKWVPHLGHRRYLSCLKHFAVMIGNRQQGRVRAQNIIDVRCTKDAIAEGIRHALSPRFLKSLRRMRNPYDRFHDGRASERIKNVLKNVPISSEFIKKQFQDLN
jgi:UDP-hydrolysing UDP-N-acetyl-D-glucosamine 2-epimerase